MKIIVDQNINEVEVSRYRSIDDVLESIRNDAADKARVVAKVTVDNILLDEKNREQIEKIDLQSVEKVEATTVLAIDTLNFISQYIKSFDLEIDRFIKAISKKKDVLEYDVFIRSLEGWRGVFELFIALHDILKIDFSHMDHGYTSVKRMAADIENMAQKVDKLFNNNELEKLIDLLSNDFRLIIHRICDVNSTIIYLVNQRQKGN